MRVEWVQAKWGGIVTLSKWTEAGHGRVRDVVRRVHAMQSTIQQKIGVAVVKIGFATGIHSEGSIWCYCSPYTCYLAQSTTQLALFAGVKVAVLHKMWECETKGICFDGQTSALNKRSRYCCPLQNYQSHKETEETEAYCPVHIRSLNCVPKCILFSSRNWSLHSSCFKEAHHWSWTMHPRAWFKRMKAPQCLSLWGRLCMPLLSSSRTMC